MSKRGVIIIVGVVLSIVLWFVFALLWAKWTDEEDMAAQKKEALTKPNTVGGASAASGAAVSSILSNAPTTFRTSGPPNFQADVRQAALMTSNRDAVLDAVKSAFKSERNEMMKWKDAAKSETLDKSSDWQTFPLAAKVQEEDGATSLSTTTREGLYNKFNCCWEGNKREEQTHREDAAVSKGKLEKGTKRGRELYDFSVSDGGRHTAVIANFLDLAGTEGTKVGTKYVKEMDAQALIQLANNPEPWLNESNRSDGGQLNRKLFLTDARRDACTNSSLYVVRPCLTSTYL
eukprot:jgi/Mesvir1/15107/Mv14747-RA.1